MPRRNKRTEDEDQTTGAGVNSDKSRKPELLH